MSIETSVFLSPAIDPDRSWRQYALCRGMDVDEFVGSHSQHAPAVCTDCPVKAQCLEFGLVNHMDGWWGGTSSGERHKLRIANRMNHNLTTRVHGTEYCYRQGCRREECRAAKARATRAYRDQQAAREAKVRSGADERRTA